MGWLECNITGAGGHNWAGLGMISRGTLSVAGRHKWRMSWAGLSITTLSGLGHLQGILDRFGHSDIELA